MYDMSLSLARSFFLSQTSGQVRACWSQTSLSEKKTESRYVLTYKSLERKGWLRLSNYRNKGTIRNGQTAQHSDFFFSEEGREAATNGIRASPGGDLSQH